MSEFYTDIKGYEGIYQVSNEGNVRRVYKNGKTKVLKPYTAGNGYLVVGLSADGIRSQQYVHRLVLGAFLANPKGKATVNHENGDKTCNKLENLVWMTHSENMQHAYDSGLRKKGKKSKK